MYKNIADQNKACLKNLKINIHNIIIIIKIDFITKINTIK